MAKMLSLLLQRGDPRHPWGFSVQGGLQDRTPLLVNQVTPGTLAAQYLAPGDTILQIDKADTQRLWLEQVEDLLTRPSKSLDLMILKGQGQSTSKVGRREESQYVSSDSGSASSTSCGRDLRNRKQHFWERVSTENPDYCREGFTKLDTGEDSPFKTRQRIDQWKRCQSEERSNPKFDDRYASLPSETKGRSRKLSDTGFYSNRIKSVWSPTPTDSFLSTPTSNYWSREEKTTLNGGNHRNDAWSLNSDNQRSEPTSYRTESLNRNFKRQHSDFSHGHTSLSSTPRSNFSTRESPYESKEYFVKEPSEFWNDVYRDYEHGRLRFGGFTSPTKNLNKVWNNSNISSKTEFKKSTSLSEKSYSSKEGTKSFETYEEVNQTKETEKTSKTGDDGKAEVVEKTKKNKEYILANKDDVDGKPLETKKIINDFQVTEKVIDGDNEVVNKVKERTKEVINSSTPVNFYDNFQQQGVGTHPTAEMAERCNHSVSRDKLVGVVRDDGANDEGTSTQSFSENHDDHGRQQWSRFTPVSEMDGFVFEGEPLQESYFEVDIRSPLESQSTFPLQENSIRRQSSQISGGGSPIPYSPQGELQAAPPPPPPPFPTAPPPPPPPGLTGSIPPVRLSTEIPDKRRSAYEPPAAIQNAMMTKDKKPFTYTPGGLDLSEIRSPRMARRINRNANTPDMAPCQPRPASIANQPLPPSAIAAMQPQIAIPVLPQGGGVSQLHHVTPGGHSGPPPPPPPPQPKLQPISPLAQSIPSPPHPVQPPSSPKVQTQLPSPQRVMNRQPSPPLNSVPKLQPQHRHTKSEPQSNPGSIYVPPIEPQQPRSQLGSLYIPPIAQQEPPKPQSPVSQLNKAPTPWMSRQAQGVQKEVPPWVNKENVRSPSPQPQSPQQQGYNQQPKTRVIPIQIEGKEPSQPNTRIIPIQLEGTPSPQHTQAPPNYSQQPSYQQQQYQPQQYQQQQYQQQPTYQQQPAYQQQQSYEQPNQGRQTPRWMNQQPVYVHNKFNSGSQSPVPVEQIHVDNQPGWRHVQSNGSMQSPTPVQSRSFKVLEKITGADNGEVDQTDAPYNSQGVPLSQLRKLQLSDDDRALMNKVKSQVDDETYLHNESDPRYRGSAIPSRAFRILQTMTDGTGEESEVPRAYSPVQSGQNKLANRTPQPDSPQQYVPPSEQQAPEPRKYTGGAIPSRSFRMLQAMTAGSESPDRPGESEF